MKRRLLMLNWRDRWHPAAGGAELITYRILQRLAGEYGWYVEWFSAAYPGAPEMETRDGIHFVRAGWQATVHLHAFARYRGSMDFDVIVDQTNTIPFLARLYSRVPVTLFIHQLARELWFYEAPKALAPFGYAAEPLLLSVYRSAPIITVSESTASSLRGIGLRGKISVIPECVDDDGDATKPAKNPRNDIVYLGRVVPSKRVEESIAAAAELKKSGWSGTLHVVGAGEDRYRNDLARLAATSDAPVTFHGKVTDERRGELLGACALLWMTSVREGWGLVVTEAGRHWTPAIVYDSPGLRDAVRHERTGLVVAPDHRVLASSTKELFGDVSRLANYGAQARSFACELNWDRTTQAFLRAIEDAVAR